MGAERFGHVSSDLRFTEGGVEGIRPALGVRDRGGTAVQERQRQRKRTLGGVRGGPEAGAGREAGGAWLKACGALVMARASERRVVMGFVFHRGHTASRVLVRFRELPRAVAVWGCGRGAEVSEGLLAVCHGDARQGCRPRTGQCGAGPHRGARGAGRAARLPECGSGWWRSVGDQLARPTGPRCLPLSRACGAGAGARDRGSRGCVAFGFLANTRGASRWATGPRGP